MPLPQRTLDLLRAYWRTAAPRPRVGMPRGPWLFANREATGPLHATSLQKTFAAVVRTSGLTKPASIHTLRHSYATHLLRGALRLSLVSDSELSVVPRRERARLAHRPRVRAAAGALLPPKNFSRSTSTTQRRPLCTKRRDARLHIPASCTSAITTERETANVS